MAGLKLQKLFYICALLKALQTVLIDNNKQSVKAWRISAPILEERATENAFRILENQLGNTVLLNGVSKEVFAMTLHDNIDRNEETLTGKFKLNSSLKINFCSQKCNLNETRFCPFLCNGIEEIISYRYILF